MLTYEIFKMGLIKVKEDSFFCISLRYLNGQNYTALCRKQRQIQVTIALPHLFGTIVRCITYYPYPLYQYNPPSGQFFEHLYNTQ